MKKSKTQEIKEEPSKQEKQLLARQKFQEDTKRVILGGFLALLITAIGGWLVGRITGGEGHMLLSVALETTRNFCGTITLALGNILALMLTLLSLSANSNVNLAWEHYERIKQIAWVITLVLIGSILIYLLLNIPLEKSDQRSGQYFSYLYYFVLFIGSALGAALISVVLLLHNTVKDIIHAVGPGEDQTDLYSDILISNDKEN